MKPGARLKTIAELVETIAKSDEPSDRFLSIYFKKNRYIGSKDRKYISEGVYGCLREKIFLEEGVKAFTGDRNVFEKRVILYAMSKGMLAQEVGQLCDGSRYHMRSLSSQELAYIDQLPNERPKGAFVICPSLQAPFQRAFGTEPLIKEELSALMEKGPVDIRVNTLKGNRDQVQEGLAEKGIETELTPFSPVGLRLKKAVPLKNLELFKQGFMELQDEGSQLTAPLLGVDTHHRVLDYCAGAGGKTLALSAIMKNKGKILATDICPKRLQKTIPRLKRAGCANVQVDPTFLEKTPENGGSFDRIFVDAPCSGSGTWRRHPEELERTSLDTVLGFQVTQKKILRAAARHLKSEGFLLYVTCSVFKEENEDVIEDFLTHHSQWAQVSINRFCDFLPSTGMANPVYLKLSPYRTQTDGFFAALLEKK